MKLAKALEILEDIILDEAYQSGTDTYHAMALATEAMKVIIAVRPWSNSNHGYWLPGETPPYRGD